MVTSTRLLDSMSQAVIAIDPAGVILHWNQRASEMFGEPIADAIGRPMKDFVADTNASHAMLKRLQQMQSGSGEIVARNPDGADMLLTVSAHAILDDAGKGIGVLLQAEHFGERQRAESEQRLLAEVGAILSSSLESEAILDRLCRLLVPELGDMCTFYTHEEDGSTRVIASAYNGVTLKEIYRLLEAERDESDAPAPVAATLRDGSAMLVDINDDTLRAIARSSREYDLLRAAGFSSTISVALRARGRTIGALGLARCDTKFDQRHLRLAEEIARRAAVQVDNQKLYESAVLANKSKSDFLAVISHELRTPLTTIMGYVELMVSGVPERLPEKSAEFLERVRTAAWHLLGLIEQILIYARLEAGRENLMPVTVVVSQLLNDVRALVEPNAIDKGVSFVVGHVPADLVLMSDLTKIRQIMLNLASNSVKFTNDGEIYLRAVADGQDIVLSVQDTGIGIAMEHSERVFDAFWQVDQSDTRNVGGAGLGLSVSRRLARLLGGELTFTSSPGLGTVFEVRLPRTWKPREELARG
ncbi:MAG: ATP-binding protein [Longimicrobiales bacterium]